jgi:endonuclease/exonuclease/phosphatase (EEP) superfamily protein YafD
VAARSSRLLTHDLADLRVAAEIGVALARVTVAASEAHYEAFAARKYSAALGFGPEPQALFGQQLKCRSNGARSMLEGASSALAVAAFASRSAWRGVVAGAATTRTAGARRG